jgi:hypothetical protein
LVCFVLVQIETYFPSTGQEISLKSPIFTSDKPFQNNFRAMAAVRKWQPAYTRAQHTCQNRPRLLQVFQVLRCYKLNFNLGVIKLILFLMIKYKNKEEIHHDKEVNI